MYSKAFYQVHSSNNLNIFCNDYFLCIEESDLHTFVDDNAITATCNTLTKLLKTSEQESGSAVRWFKQNEMIANAEKFQVIVLNKKESQAKYKLAIDGSRYSRMDQVKFVGNSL